MIELLSKMLFLIKPIFLYALTICAHLIDLPQVLANDIRHVELNGAHLIDTSATNYAMNAPEFTNANNWKTVVVNDDNLIATTVSCETIVKNLNSLSEIEKGLLSKEKEQLESVDTGGFNVIEGTRYSSSRFSFDGTRAKLARGNIHWIRTYQHNGLSMCKHDETNYSMAKQGAPNNVLRVFITNGHLITLVYQDGSLQMKPITCLQPAEAQLLLQLKLEDQKAEQELNQSGDSSQPLQNLQPQLDYGSSNNNNNLNNSWLNYRQQRQLEKRQLKMYRKQFKQNRRPNMHNLHQNRRYNLFKALQQTNMAMASLANQEQAMLDPEMLLSHDNYYSPHPYQSPPGQVTTTNNNAYSPSSYSLISIPLIGQSFPGWNPLGEIFPLLG